MPVPPLFAAIGGRFVMGWSPAAKAASVQLTAGNQTASNIAGAPVNANVKANKGFTANGTYNWFITITGVTAPTIYPGVGCGNNSSSLTLYMGNDDNSLAYQPNGTVLYLNASVGTLATFTAGDIIGVRLVLSGGTKTVAFNKNGGAFSATFNVAALGSPIYPMAGFNAIGDAETSNFAGL